MLAAFAVFLISVFMVLSCAPSDQGEPEELDCPEGECDATIPAITCPSFEVSCEESRVKGCNPCTMDGRGCCMTQQDLEEELCE